MAVELILPALGESVTEGTVTRWLKQVGDHVSADEPVVEVSTDKVDTEVPAPATGVITQILHQEDAIVPVGTVLALIGDAAEQVAVVAGAPEGQASVAQAASAVSDTAAAEVSQGLGWRLPQISQETDVPPPPPAPEPEAQPKPEPEPVVLTVPAPGPVAAVAPVPEAVERTASVPAAVVTEPVATESASPEHAAPESQALTQESASDDAEPASGSPYVVPLVRKLAGDLDVDLNAVVGTGVGGRIRKEDVQAAADASAAQRAVSTDEPANEAAGAATGARTTVLLPQLAVPGTSQPLSQIQAATAERLVESQHSSAQLSATVELDLTGIEPALRLAAIVKAASAALSATPSVNASIEGNIATYHREANIGIACETDFGLIVPVIRLAIAKAVTTIAQEITEAAKGATLGLVAPQQLVGGTFTIVDNSATGALLTSAIINQPQVAILSIGAAGQRPKVVADAFGVDTIVVRTLAYATLTYDRRIVSPADAGEFLAALARALA
ncbi:MAG: 2-oxo acid dehydrogenase subunit E2 [Propionibacteriaceae bacterium]|jgi:2-oxoglutarate dehydrogenase E2 component (dihydrolipoamide succinyltransferase)|nr:2-oxo acid dehydrogenase subunit E2 [Propionibacteriaceae bacterium]